MKTRCENTVSSCNRSIVEAALKMATSVGEPQTSMRRSQEHSMHGQNVIYKFVMCGCCTLRFVSSLSLSLYRFPMFWNLVKGYRSFLESPLSCHRAWSAIIAKFEGTSYEYNIGNPPLQSPAFRQATSSSPLDVCSTC